MLLYVNFAKDACFHYFRKKYENSATVCKSNPNPNPNFQSRLIRKIGVVLSNGTLLSYTCCTCCSIKERIQTTMPQP